MLTLVGVQGRSEPFGCLLTTRPAAFIVHLDSGVVKTIEVPVEIVGTSSTPRRFTRRDLEAQQSDTMSMN